MAEKPDAGQEFSAFLRSCGSVDDLTSGKVTTVRGSVYRSSTEGSFAVQTADGQLLEMETSAVERFRVIGKGLHPEVELSISAEALKNARQLKSVIADGMGHTIFAKDIRTDPIVDHKLIIKDIHTDPIADQTLFVLDHKLPHKDIAKDPITDPIGTAQGFDPPGGTLAETAAEAGGFDPGQVVTNPAFATQAGMMPFVMATPHHAPAQMVNMQMGAAGGGAGLKASYTETIKELSGDHTFKEVIHDTHKELIFDTHKELVYDTRKEVFETLVEGGGTIQEGTTTAAEGGQFPGGFPGMPGF